MCRHEMSKMTSKNDHGILRRFLFFLRFLEIRLRFVAILVITALVVGYWDHLQNYYERWQRERQAREHAGHDAASTTSDVEYFCGMHPFVVRDRPGKCPICGMDLTMRKKGEAVALPEGVIARVQVSPERVMQAGVQVEPVLYRLLSRSVQSYGVIEVDETRLSNVVARFPGRVEEVMVDATGLTVTRGQPLVRIYSPEFLAGSDEYVRALAGQQRLNRDPKVSDEERRRAQVLVESARKRLRLAGFTNEQLDAMARLGEARDSITLYSPVAGTVMEKNVLPGQTVDEGTPIYTIADLSTLWVQVLMVESDLASVTQGMPVEITTVSYPGEIFYGTVDFINPVVNAENRTVKVRVVVKNVGGKLKPGMYANAAIRSPIGRYGPIETMGDVHAERPAGRPDTLPTETQADAEAFLASLPAGSSYYTCTMDPEVMSDKPGECPLCGMKLVERTKGAVAAASAANVSLPTSTARDAEAFLATVPPGAQYFTCTMDPEVVSDKPGECPLCGMALTARTMPASGSPEGEEGPTAGSYERWAEGYTCPMHPDLLSETGGPCTVCGCGMETSKWRVERVLAVPETAVIDTGMRKVVYVETEPGLYDARAVELGPRAGAYYPVLAGLTLGQRIATRGAFLIDAEARLNPAMTGGQGAATEFPESEHRH